MVNGGTTVCFVTHLFDFAHSRYEQHRATALVLRAERECGRHRTYRIAEGEPLSTSFGQDLCSRISALIRPDQDPA